MCKRAEFIAKGNLESGVGVCEQLELTATSQACERGELSLRSSQGESSDLREQENLGGGVSSAGQAKVLSREIMS